MQQRDDLAPYRSGFITVVGRPNVGKSTLINALVGTRVAITSSRPETTRKVIRGIVTTPDAQMVLVDTPGIHRPRTLLGSRLNDMVEEALTDSDAVLFLLPADQRIGPGDKRILSRLRATFSTDAGGWKVPVIAVVTKIDNLSRDELVAKLIEIDQFGEFSDIVPVSALKDDNVQEVKQVCIDRLPEGPQMYPDDQLTEEGAFETIAELVRGAFLETLEDELPHSLAVVVDSIEYPEQDSDAQAHGSSRNTAQQRNNAKTGKPIDALSFGPTDGKAHVYVSIYVERDSQKPIIIGPQAKNLVAVRKKLRTSINRIVGCKTKLELHVKVAKSWQSDPKQLEKLGF